MNGNIFVNIIVKKIEEKKLTIISDNLPPKAKIAYPISGLYLLNKKIIPLQNTIFIGRPHIKLEIDDVAGINQISYYLNNNLIQVTEEPVMDNVYLNQRMIGNQLFSAVISDYAGNKKTIDHKMMIINLF